MGQLPTLHQLAETGDEAALLLALTSAAAKLNVNETHGRVRLTPKKHKQSVAPRESGFVFFVSTRGSRGGGGGSSRREP